VQQESNREHKDRTMSTAEAKAIATGIIWLGVGLCYVSKKSTGDGAVAVMAMLSTIAVWSDGCGCGG